MYISSWEKIYRGMENKKFEAFLVTGAFDVNLGVVKFESHIDVMNDLIITVKTLENQQILQYNSLDAAAIESGRHPFLQGLFNENKITTYYRIKFPKIGASLHLKLIN